MKKNYSTPEIEILTIDIETPILSQSPFTTNELDALEFGGNAW